MPTRSTSLLRRSAILLLVIIRDRGCVARDLSVVRPPLLAQSMIYRPRWRVSPLSVIAAAPLVVYLDLVFIVLYVSVRRQSQVFGRSFSLRRILSGTRGSARVG